MKRRIMFFCLLLVVLSCSREKGDTTLFENQKSLGAVSEKLSEASGLVASVVNPGYLWSQNDGGNPSEIYLINEKAEIVLTCKLKRTNNRDWEDITIGPGPEPGTSYIYVADIGDNQAVYPNKILYRIKEPKRSDSTKIQVHEIDKLVFNLPDGQRDSESIMFDPISSNFYLISKREKSVRLYEMRINGDSVHIGKAVRIPFQRIVAANISADGSEVLLKNYDTIYYWKRKGDEPIAELLQRDPVKIDYEPELQGEAIAWKSDGTGFYTLSESGLMNPAHLFFFKRKQSNQD